MKFYETNWWILFMIGIFVGLIVGFSLIYQKNLSLLFYVESGNGAVSLEKDCCAGSVKVSSWLVESVCNNDCIDMVTNDCGVMTFEHFVTTACPSCAEDCSTSFSSDTIICFGNQFTGSYTSSCEDVSSAFDSIYNTFLAIFIIMVILASILFFYLVYLLYKRYRNNHEHPEIALKDPLLEENPLVNEAGN